MSFTLEKANHSDPNHERQSLYNPGNTTLGDMVKIAKEQHEADQAKYLQWRNWSKEFRFDITKNVADQIFSLKVRSGDRLWDLAGAGALGVIAGPPKSRKTAVTSAIEAAGLSGKEILGFQLDIADGRILTFDTEQKESSFSKVKKNVYAWAGLTDNQERYEPYRLRTLYPAQRLECIKAHVFADDKPRAKLLVIDVVTDLLYGFNDEVKSQLLVEDIMKMAGDDTLTLLTIHLGKGNNQVLGHVGSALARKVDFMLEVKLEEDYYQSTVSCRLSRDVPMFPEFSIRQEMSPNRIYRPDLERGGWVHEATNAFGSVPDVSIKAQPVVVDDDSDDDIPF